MIDRRLRVEQRLHAGVVGRLHALAARHAERAQPAVPQRLGGDPLKELGVLRVRERVAAFDEIEAELVEPPGDEQLVLQREVDAFALGAVAERGVVDLDLSHNVRTVLERRWTRMQRAGIGIDCHSSIPCILRSSILQQKNPEAFWPQGWCVSSADRTDPQGLRCAIIITMLPTMAVNNGQIGQR